MQQAFVTTAEQIYKKIQNKTIDITNEVCYVQQNGLFAQANGVKAGNSENTTHLTVPKQTTESGGCC